MSAAGESGNIQYTCKQNARHAGSIARLKGTPRCSIMNTGSVSILSGGREFVDVKFQEARQILIEIELRRYVIHSALTLSPKSPMSAKIHVSISNHLCKLT